MSQSSAVPPATSASNCFASSVGLAKGGAVWQWLSDLRCMTELECVNVLQAKPLQIENPQTDPAIAIKEAKESIDALKGEADTVSEDFAHLFRCFKSSRWSELRGHSLVLMSHIQSLVRATNVRLDDVPVFVVEQQELVLGESSKLLQQSARFSLATPDRTDGGHSNTIPMVNQLTFVGQSFSRLVDMTIGHLVQKIVDSLCNGQGLAAVHAAIACIISLGLEGEHMCFIVAREGGVRGLLDVCRNETLTFTRSQALRALATVCCAPECITKFEKERGFQLLVDLLREPVFSGEAIQGEAAGVVAQLTSPCLQHSPQQLGILLQDLHHLLQALLQLMVRTLSHDVFLLSTAAIANITFLSNPACSVLLQIGAPELLIKASSGPKARSPFAKDQVVTVLANMAAQSTCQVDICHHGGVELLVRYLHERPLSLAGKAEVAACERVQQKAAITLSRLCRYGNSTDSIISTRVVPRLVELCRHSEARNNSDAVLVACLAALRKMCSVNGGEGMKAVDLQQLVLPQLMDSFLICSHADENFV